VLLIKPRRMEPEEEQEQNKKNGIKREFFKDNFDSP
jgi:hypothetical protein